MSKNKGFTLVEIVVTLVILSILALIALPNYTTMLRQGAARAAQNNLVAIYNAEKAVYLGPTGAYCTTSCDNIADINTNLVLNITDSNFSYACGTTNGFTCTATSTSDSNLILTVTKDSIILPGGTGCPSTGPWVAPCNPTCATDISSYCPTS